MEINPLLSTSGHPGPDHILVQTEELLEELELDAMEDEDEDEEELLEDVITQLAISHLNVIHQFVTLFDCNSGSHTPNTTSLSFLYIGSDGLKDINSSLTLIELIIEEVSPVKEHPLSKRIDLDGGTN